LVSSKEKDGTYVRAYKGSKKILKYLEVPKNGVPSAGEISLQKSRSN